MVDEATRDRVRATVESINTEADARFKWKLAAQQRDMALGKMRDIMQKALNANLGDEGDGSQLNYETAIFACMFILNEATKTELPK